MTDRHPCDSAHYELHQLSEAIGALERRFASESGREEMDRELTEIAECDARLHAIAFHLRNRLTRAA